MSVERSMGSNGGPPVLGGEPARGDIVAMGRRPILRATRQVLLERGPAGVTVSGVAARAEISRSGFYRLFENMGECARAALEELAEEWRMAMLEAFAQERHWQDGARVGLAEVVASARPYLDAPGMALQGEPARAPARGARGERLREPATSAMAELPRVLRQPRAGTLRACLWFLAKSPGASNAQVRVAIGVRYNSQVCRALGRLQELELVVKRVGSPGKPNAWTLSPEGERALVPLDAFESGGSATAPSSRVARPGQPRDV